METIKLLNGEEFEVKDILDKNGWMIHSTMGILENTL